MAIFVGFIMISSVAGFAIMSVDFNSDAGTSASVPNIVKRAMTTQERLSVFKAGKVLVQFHYPMNCTSCASDITTVESFVSSKQANIALEEYAVQDNETLVLRMISPSGAIQDLQGGLTEDSLLDSFCGITYVQTKECLLRGIGRTTATNNTTI
jgi:hypothetical protein